MTRPKLVIFDNDGVVVDSERLANTILAELLTEAGLPYTLDEAVRDFMGGTLGSMREKAEARLGSALPIDLEDRYHERLFDRFATLQRVPGVTEVLDHLDNMGIPYCLASSGTHERIATALRSVGLWERFEGRIFSADDVEHGKPAPDLFLLAARAMGVTPADSLVVEDSPLGVAAAKAARMKVFGYAAMTPPEKLSSADQAFDDMSELARLIESA